MISPARIAAYDILAALSSGRADLPTAIAFTRVGLKDDRDRALAADIAAGVQRWRAALDYLITAFAKRAIDRLDPEVVDILRLSTYQLLHLTRVPASAVVDDAVNLTRRAAKQSAAGFVNAILRTVSRRRNSLPLPPRPVTQPPSLPVTSVPPWSPPSPARGTEVTGDGGGQTGTEVVAARDGGDEWREAALEYLSITLSHPRWLAARWLDRFGFEVAESWMQFNNTPAPLTLRVNRLRASPEQAIERLAAEGVLLRRGAFARDALIVEEGHPLRGSQQELFVVQDEASQLVAILAEPRPGLRVLDTCASPGGKTTALAAALNGTGLLVACDVRDRRMALLRKTIAGAGADGVRLVQADLLKPLPFARSFDLVLVDAPCSGLGTLRRDPDIRWRRRESDLASLAAAELVMLQHAAEAVVPGGRLVYATCSSEPEENEGVVDAFLATSPEFSPIDARDAAPGLPRGVIDAHGRLRTDSHAHGLEAFFGAVLERRKV
jgi:16S rRNA (cytosine967-C5)-methyltransferase